MLRLKCSFVPSLHIIISNQSALIYLLHFQYASHSVLISISPITLIWFNIIFQILTRFWFPWGAHCTVCHHVTEGNISHCCFWLNPQMRERERLYWHSCRVLDFWDDSLCRLFSLLKKLTSTLKTLSEKDTETYTCQSLRRLECACVCVCRFSLPCCLIHGDRAAWNLSYCMLIVAGKKSAESVCEEKNGKTFQEHFKMHFNNIIWLQAQIN